MKHIEALIGGTSNEADKTILASKKDQKRNLSDCQPCCSNAEGLVMLSAGYIVVDEFKRENEAKISQEKADGTEGRDFDPKSLFGRSELHI